MSCNKHINELSFWIETALNKENVTSFAVKNTRNCAVGGGYISELFFVDVIADKNNRKEEYNFVIKLSTKEFRHVCRKELFVYNDIVSEFERLVSCTTSEEVELNFLPKCYATIIEEDRDIIVLQDVTKFGFQLRDRWKAMSHNTIKQIVTTYGKLHALTFALRENDPTTYQALKEGFKQSNPVGGFWNGSFYKKLLNFAERCVSETLTELGEVDLLRRFVEGIGSFDKTLEQFYDSAEESHLVFTHGDCWNNNYLFKFDDEDTNQDNPKEVILVDFQLSELQSPAIDLGHFLYSNASTKELGHFQEIFEVYHASFAHELKKFDLNANKLFSFENLVTHWYKYAELMAIIGLIAINMVLKDNPGLDVMTAEYEDFTHVNHKKEFEERMLGIVRHCLDFKFNN